ncbi:MAG: hypothetical protein A4E53_02070 [Pelotomaculum sp. PtaB.Bin104]|nr:MAG: hypothetical protein A4E53_02070 [Pelotomaculum sp. PtaB.Bin104]
MSENRTVTGRFMKGHSGNPGGRPKLASELKLSMQELTGNAVFTIKEIMSNQDAPPASRLKCAELILAYGIGRPVQQMQIEVETEISEKRQEYDLSLLSLDELLQLEKIVSKALPPG